MKHLGSIFSLAIVGVMASACGRPGIGSESAGETDSEGGGSPVTSSTGAPVTTSGSPSTTSPETDTGPDGDDSADGWDVESGDTDTGDGDGDWGEEDTETGDGDGDGPGNGEGQPGDVCEENADCDDGYCFVIPVLGGVCGECSLDSHCPDGGCDNPNPLAGTGPVCNTGALGDGCDSSEVCQPGLSCELVLDVAGILQAQTCSECGPNTPCSGALLCAPTYALQDFAGHFSCEAPGSQPNGEGCEATPGGEAVCASGICAEVDIMGLAQIGVCSECDSGADCVPGQSCQFATADVESGEITPGLCVGG